MVEKIKISNVKNPVSRLVYGCAGEAILRGDDVSGMLDAVYDLGINTFDTAENYGLSEVSLGKWISGRGIREKVNIISKGCHPYEQDRMTPENMRMDIEQSFKRLKTDYIDIYFLHRDSLIYPVGPMVEIMNEYHAAGKIGAFGGSNWTCKRINEANEYAAEHKMVPFTVSSPHFGLASQIVDPWGGAAGCVNISGSEHSQDRNFYREKKIPVFAYSSLAHGFFTGRIKSYEAEAAKKLINKDAVTAYCYPENFKRLKRAEELAKEKHAAVSQIALAWLLCQDFEVFPIVTTSNSKRLEENAGALKIKLTKSELEWLDLEKNQNR